MNLSGFPDGMRNLPASAQTMEFNEHLAPERRFLVITPFREIDRTVAQDCDVRAQIAYHARSEEPSFDDAVTKLILPLLPNPTVGLKRPLNLPLLRHEAITIKLTAQVDLK